MSLANRRSVVRFGSGWLLASLAPTVAIRSAVASTNAPGEVASTISGARLLGQGRLTFFGLHIYDARLWVGEGFEATRFAEQALALELIYARKLVGQQIAERSMKEMQRLGAMGPDQSSRWLGEMVAAFPDVEKNDRLTGIHVPATAARFYVNGQPRREIRDPEFARRFFGIWLAEGTSQPTLRNALLGRAS